MLKDFISKRKSTRKYNMTPLENSTLKNIEDFAKTLVPLYEGIKVEYQLVSAADVKNILPIKAPHYIIISSENRDGYLTNIGFLFQQMDLYLSSVGLGSCWLGMAKPMDSVSTKLEFVIIIAFGNAINNPHRDLVEFKRKPFLDISTTADVRLEVARLAPSSTNSQPWYFVSDKDSFHIFCVKYGIIKSLIYKKMNKIDIGIALAHLYLSNPIGFEFTQDEKPQELKGYYYIGSVKLN